MISARDRADPFFAGGYSGTATFYCDAASRLSAVNLMDAKKLRAVITLGDEVQKSVRQAAERRLRKLGART